MPRFRFTFNPQRRFPELAGKPFRLLDALNRPRFENGNETGTAVADLENPIWLIECEGQRIEAFDDEVCEPTLGEAGPPYDAATATGMYDA